MNIKSFYIMNGLSWSYYILSSGNIIITSSGKHTIESFIMDVIINSTSESFTKGSNLFFEKFNNPVKIGFFTISSISFLMIESFLSNKNIFSINNILVRLSG